MCFPALKKVQNSGKTALNLHHLTVRNNQLTACFFLCYFYIIDIEGLQMDLKEQKKGLP
jgi:hypothetical protein